jgi:acetyl-CoA carboxylase biotin carboxyl carrier protein
LGSSPFTFKDALELVELIKRSSTFSELRIRSGDLEIEVRRGPRGTAPEATERPAPIAAPPVPDPSAPPPPPPSVPTLAPVGSATPPSKAGTVVTAPMVGTIYRAPEPGANPFVEVGQRVAKSDQLCIIEVMKLMNAVLADHAGTVAEILVEDAEAVTFAQPLFVIAPD